MPAGIIPSPTGRATPHRQMTAQHHNPMFGQIMNYQLGRQTNQANERNVQTQAFQQALTSLLNNPGNQQAMGAVNSTAAIERALQGGGAGFRGGYSDLELSPAHPNIIQPEQQRAVRMGIAGAQGDAGKAGSTWGQVPSNEGYMRPMSENELLQSVIMQAAGTPNKPNSEIKQKNSVSNEVTAPVETPGGGYGVGTQTTESEASAKAKVHTPAALAYINELSQKNPSVGRLFEQGIMTAEDNGDGTITLLIQGSPIGTYPLNNVGQ